MKDSNLKPAFYLSAGAVLAVAVSAAGGLWLPGTYSRETPSWAAQGLGQDAVDLFLEAPLALAAAFLARKGKRIFLFVIQGFLLYFAYSYALYGFCVHFNTLFFVYCAALGLSAYALVLWILGTPPKEAGKWFETRKSTVFPAGFFLTLTLLFYFLWLSEDVPALLHGRAPASLAEAGLFTNPVHVLDLSLVLPAMLAASLQLLRKRPFGYWLFPVMGCFSVAMGVSILGMMAALYRKGLSGGLGGTAVMGTVVALDLAVLVYFFRALRKA